MKRLLLSALLAAPAFCIGQTLLYNDGAMIKVQAGATLYVEGGIQNTSTGTIDNDGTIEVKGNFLNAGTWEGSQPNTLKFSGNVNSDVTPGTAVFQSVVVAKDAGFNVNLLGNATINTDLNFTAAGATKVNLGAFDLTMGPIATINGYDSDEYVMTGGVGKMKKSYTAAGSFVFPVGFDATTYNPATLNVTAGPNDTYSVRCLAAPTDGNGLTGTPLTADVVNAVWDIQEGTGGGNTFDVTLAWAETDELTGFVDASNAVARNGGTNGWDGLHSDLGPEVGNTRTKTGYTAGGAFTVGDKAVANGVLVNAKVWLQGPYIVAGGLMVDSLRVHDYIPLTEPYSTLASNPYVHKAYGGGETVTGLSVFNQPVNGDDIVDWIVLELRSLADSTTVVASKSALIQRDGDIVDLIGTGPVSVLGVADGNYIIGIRHRNHLGVRTNASTALNSSPSTLIDFTLNGTAYDDPAIERPTTPMRTLTGGAQAMWAGDANFNAFVSFIGGSNDKNVILAVLLGNQSSVVYGYNRADLNLNGATSFIGGSNDKNVILANMAPTLGTPLQAHNN